MVHLIFFLKQKISPHFFDKGLTLLLLERFLRILKSKHVGYAQQKKCWVQNWDYHATNTRTKEQ
jgi:hypothetical protein